MYGKNEKRVHIIPRKFKMPKRLIKKEYHLGEVVQIMRVLNGYNYPLAFKTDEYYLWHDIKKWCKKNNISITNNKIRYQDLLDKYDTEMVLPDWLELYLFLEGDSIFYKLPTHWLNLERIINTPIRDFLVFKDVGVKKLQWLLLRIAALAGNPPQHRTKEDLYFDFLEAQEGVENKYEDYI